MRKTLTMAVMVVVAALAFTGCKKKKTEDTGTASGDVTASGADTGSSMAGSSMAGSSMAGSASGGTMAGSDRAGSASGGTMAGSDMAGSASGGTMAGSGSAATGELDADCAAYAAKFAKCEKLDPKMKETMGKIFDGLKGSAKAKETCQKAAKGWDTTLQKAGCD